MSREAKNDAGVTQTKVGPVKVVSSLALKFMCVRFAGWLRRHYQIKFTAQKRMVPMNDLQEYKITGSVYFVSPTVSEICQILLGEIKIWEVLTYLTPNCSLRFYGISCN